MAAVPLISHQATAAPNSNRQSETPQLSQKFPSQPTALSLCFSQKRYFRSHALARPLCSDLGCVIPCEEGRSSRRSPGCPGLGQVLLVYVPSAPEPHRRRLSLQRPPLPRHQRKRVLLLFHFFKTRETSFRWHWRSFQVTKGRLIAVYLLLRFLRRFLLPAQA